MHCTRQVTHNETCIQRAHTWAVSEITKLLFIAPVLNLAVYVWCMPSSSSFLAFALMTAARVYIKERESICYDPDRNLCNDIHNPQFTLAGPYLVGVLKHPPTVRLIYSIKQTWQTYMAILFYSRHVASSPTCIAKLKSSVELVYTCTYWSSSIAQLEVYSNSVYCVTSSHAYQYVVHMQLTHARK